MLILDIKQKLTSIQATIPEKPGNKEDPKRAVHEFLWEGKVDNKILEHKFVTLK